MKKIKTIYPVILLTLLLLASCKSKKNMVATLPRPVLNSDSIYPDTANAIAGLFSPDHSQLKELNVSKNKKQNTKKKTSTDTHESSDLVLRGTKITSSSVDVSSVYTGVDRVVKYDFTHRDVPEAFEGFRIAFISDLHYKSLLKEKGLNDLVRLLIAQKADVLLMGGDYQEGCEYVEPLFSALARVKTPMGTYGVMGNKIRFVKTGSRSLSLECAILLIWGATEYRLLWHSLPKILSSYWFTPRITSKMFQ